MNQKDLHLRTICNVQIYCQKLCWRVWSILLICQCVSPYSSYSVSFICRNNIVAIHIFHKRELSARLCMKMTSWGFYVLEVGSSGEPANRPEEMIYGVPCISGTEFEVGALRPKKSLLALRLVLP